MNRFVGEDNEGTHHRLDAKYEQERILRSAHPLPVANTRLRGSNVKRAESPTGHEDKGALPPVGRVT